MTDVLVLNGPNLNLLGTREPEVYGYETLADIEAGLRDHAATLGLTLDFAQSNHEGVLIDRIHAAREAATRFIIINPGAFTHTSIALRDALLAVSIPFIEVHLSNVHAREPFRRKSYLSDVAIGVVAGFGALGYRCALDKAAQRLATG